MEPWLIDGIMSSLAYGASDHFLMGKLKGIKRVLICLAIAVAVCCIIRFIMDSVSNYLQ